MYTGANINQVLLLVRAMNASGEDQLSILANSLVIASRSCGVPRETLFRVLDELFAADIPLVPLDVAAFALTDIEKLAQGERCSCRGTDDMCPCQNVPDQATLARRRAAG